MDLATQILVIIVSSVLVIFLISAITVAVLAAKLINEVRRLVARAADLAENAAHISEMLKDATGPMAVLKFVRNMIKSLQKK